MDKILTDGLILSVKNFATADKIVTILSPTMGKVTAICYGCRRPKSTLASAMQPFAHLNLQLQKSGNLYTVKQGEHLSFFSELYDDLVALGYGSLLLEFIKEIIVEDEPQGDIYNLALKVLNTMKKKNPRIAVLGGIVQILNTTGMQLSFDSCKKCDSKITDTGFINYYAGGYICQKCYKNEEILFTKNHLEIVKELLHLDFDNPKSFSISSKILRDVENIFYNYIRHILGKNLKSFKFIENVALSK